MKQSKSPAIVNEVNHQQNNTAGVKTNIPPAEEVTDNNKAQYI